MIRIKNTFGGLVSSERLKTMKGLTEDEFARISELEINPDELCKNQYVEYIGVTEEFRHVIELFGKDVCIPAGFRPEYLIDSKCLMVHLKRDISYDKDGKKRPTKVLFSADSANPYEVAPFKNFLANLTCNPAIIYNLFINNPKANIGNKFKDRYEVIAELANILGSGADISVEVDNPFASESQILEEIARFEEILTPYRLVVKIPHTGPINGNNIAELRKGAFPKKYSDIQIEETLAGHNLAYMIQEKGYRINFTLMFEPYQMALALQAKPYFINTFIKNRMNCTQSMKRFVDNYHLSTDKNELEMLKKFMIDNDYISPQNANMELLDVLHEAEWMIHYQDASKQYYDGLDSTRHALRILKSSSLPDTRLIICSLDGNIYPNIDKMLVEPEFSDVLDKIVITAPPQYLAQFTSAPGVLTYQRIFANAIEN